MSSSPLQPKPQAKKGKSELNPDQNEMGRCIILKEDVVPSDIKKSDLTSDCYFVHHVGGKVDVAKGSAVHIFDEYYDKGIRLTQIEMSGGSLNPKLNKPKLD